MPDEKNLAPGYEQREFSLEKNRGHWTLIAAQDGRNSAVTIHQDADVSAAVLASGEQATYRLKSDRRAWVHVARGSATLNGTVLNAGDGAAVSQEEILEIRADNMAEILLFDLP